MNILKIKCVRQLWGKDVKNRVVVYQTGLMYLKVHVFFTIQHYSERIIIFYFCFKIWCYSIMVEYHQIYFQVFVIKRRDMVCIIETEKVFSSFFILVGLNIYILMTNHPLNMAININSISSYERCRRLFLRRIINKKFLITTIMTYY